MWFRLLFINLDAYIIKNFEWSQMDIYVVQPNDTIYSIARKYGVSATNLIRDNEITKPNELVIGQTIVIVYPQKTYIVKEGDTLESIASLYNVTVMQLLRNNPFLCTKNLNPGEEITISYNTSGKTITNGYIYPYINNDILKKTLPNLTYVTIYNYRVVSGGKIISYYDDTEIIKVSKAYQTIPLMMLTTLSTQGEPDIETAYSIIENAEFQEVFFTELLNIIKQKNYLGANIIFNYLNTSNNDLYQIFVLRLSERLSAEGLILFVTVNPTTKYINNSSTFEKIDYSAIANSIKDLVFLQFIWGTNYGPPLPVNSIGTLQSFIDYVITVVPPSVLYVGYSIISYDWMLPYVPGNIPANSLSIQSSLNLAHDTNSIIKFDEVSQSPYFTYTVNNLNQNTSHIVWSVDARSILALVELINSRNLKGPGFWNLMTYVPQLWLVMNTQYEIEKLLPVNSTT